MRPRVLDNKYWTYLPAVVVAAGIALLSLLEHPERFLPPSTSDKVLHAIAYCMLAFLLVFAMEFRHSCNISHYVCSAAAATFYGLLIEVFQRLCTSTRTCSMDDLLADLSGAVIGVVMYFIFFRR